MKTKKLTIIIIFNNMVIFELRYGKQCNEFDRKRKKNWKNIKQALRIYMEILYLFF